MRRDNKVGSGMLAFLVTFVPLRAVFPSVVVKPEMLDTLAGMDQKDSYAPFLGSGLYKAGIFGDNAPRAVFSSLVRKRMMFGIMAVMTRRTVATWCPCCAEAVLHGPDC